MMVLFVCVSDRASSAGAAAPEHAGLLSASHHDALDAAAAGLLDVPAPQASVWTRGHRGQSVSQESLTARVSSQQRLHLVVLLTLVWCSCFCYSASVRDCIFGF